MILYPQLISCRDSFLILLTFFVRPSIIQGQWVRREVVHTKKRRQRLTRFFIFTRTRCRGEQEDGHFILAVYIEFQILVFCFIQKVSVASFRFLLHLRVQQNERQKMKWIYNKFFHRKIYEWKCLVAKMMRCHYWYLSVILEDLNSHCFPKIHSMLYFWYLGDCWESIEFL